MRKIQISVVCGLVIMQAAIFGCVAKPNAALMSSVRAGEHSSARDTVAAGKTNNQADRKYMLGRMQSVIVNMADGMGDISSDEAYEIWEVLKTRGINDDKTVVSVVLNEDLKFWKGEPFEQAMMYGYASILMGSQGEWGNANAAADGSLFMLKNFGRNKDGEIKSSHEIASDAVVYDKDNKRNSNKIDYFEIGYSPMETNFALGHLLKAISSRAQGRNNEAVSHVNAAIEINGNLREIGRSILSGRTNTILIVDAGLGPQKTAYGPDNALAKFVPQPDGLLSFSKLQVTLGSQNVERMRPVCDVNLMAVDHFWNNLEDTRLAKSRIGTALMVTGAYVAGSSRNNDNGAAAMVGLLMMITGAIQKAGAHADTRYCEVVPQLVYVVPLNLPESGGSLDLEVEGYPATELYLPWIPGNSKDEIELRYVRLNHPKGELPVAPVWAVSGKTYFKDSQFPYKIAGDALPYILGGTDVSIPSADVLSRYQAAGWLQDMTVTELENLYFEEGISMNTDQEIDFMMNGAGSNFRHILEGGTTLLAPDITSAGYRRIFGQLHQEYQPVSDYVYSLKQQIIEKKEQQQLTAVER